MIAAVAGRSLTIADGGEPERYLGAGVSWGLFPMLGTRPILRRGFTADEDRAGAGDVVLMRRMTRSCAARKISSGGWLAGAPRLPRTW